jgi:hypothetical protein
MKRNFTKTGMKTTDKALAFIVLSLEYRLTKRMNPKPLSLLTKTSATSPYLENIPFISASSQSTKFPTNNRQRPVNFLSFFEPEKELKLE